MAALDDATAALAALSIPGLFSLAPDGEGIPFCAVQLGFADGDDTLYLGLGKHWRLSPATGHFLGVGASFPGLESFRHPGDDEREGPTLALGTWVGGGAYWTPWKNLDLGMGIRWIPERENVAGSSDEVGAFQAVGSAIWRW